MSVNMKKRGKRSARRPKPVSEIEKRLRRVERAVEFREEGSRGAVTLADVLRAYPGRRGRTGIAELAHTIQRNTDTVYDFEKGRNRRRRYPAEVGSRIAAAFARRDARPFGIEVTERWLLEAWSAVPIEKG